MACVSDLYNNCIRICDQVVTIQGPTNPPLADVLHEFGEQLRRLRKVRNRDGSFRYYGKEPSSNARDDMLIAFMMASLYSIQAGAQLRQSEHINLPFIVEEAELGRAPEPENNPHWINQFVNAIVARAQ